MGKAHGFTGRKSPKPWTNQEIDILKEHYPTKGPRECAKLLAGRTIGSIVHQAGKLNIVSITFWTQEEDNILRQYYPIGGSILCRQYLTNDWNKVSNRITARARRLGLRFVGERMYVNKLEIANKYSRSCFRNKADKNIG